MSLWQPVGLGKIATLINAGKIDSSELITMKTLKVRSIALFPPSTFVQSGDYCYNRIQGQ